MVKTPLTGLTPEAIAEQLGLKPFQGKQVFRWIHAKGIFDFEQMTDLAKPLRTQLQEQYVAGAVELVEVQQSVTTGTKKVLLKLADGETVESVLIRDRERTTLCLSSQVGCPLQCSFCATGLAGFSRNLTAGEIVEQALYLLKDEPLGGRTPNIVYMGMGEPFRNYEAVTDSIRLLMNPLGVGIGARKITVSTAGEVKQIALFAEEPWQVRLSVSLHAANNTLRSELVPLNRKYPLERLREAVLAYELAAGRQLTFEWTLLKDVNDSKQHADELVDFIGDLRASVNLIPWNPVRGIPYDPSPRVRCEEFRDHLEKRGVTATLRKERGQDIDAACGQLRRIHAA
jgi:23S rRNA (adenine2503-C2)-methyltransferase